MEAKARVSVKAAVLVLTAFCMFSSEKSRGGLRLWEAGTRKVA